MEDFQADSDVLSLATGRAPLHIYYEELGGRSSASLQDVIRVDKMTSSLGRFAGL